MTTMSIIRQNTVDSLYALTSCRFIYRASRVLSGRCDDSINERLLWLKQRRMAGIMVGATPVRNLLKRRGKKASCRSSKFPHENQKTFSLRDQ